MGLDDEQDLTALQLAIMAAPMQGDVIEGTDGLRKLRFSPPGWKQGKSGATRVLYVCFAEFHLVLLCLVYAKSEVDDISAATKKKLNGLVREIAVELRRRKRSGVE